MDKPKRPPQDALKLAPSKPSNPPSHFRTPHTVRPVAGYLQGSQITWYSSGLFWGLASVELIAAGAVGLWTRHWMGPDFLFCLGVIGVAALLVCWLIRMTWRDEWIVRILGLLLVEAVAVARLLCSDHPGVKRYENLIIMMVAAALLFLVRFDGSGERYSSRRSWWRSCSSGGFFGGGSSSGGGGCGG